jgi:hypothetical protein
MHFIPVIVNVLVQQKYFDYILMFTINILNFTTKKMIGVEKPFHYKREFTIRKFTINGMKCIIVFSSLCLSFLQSIGSAPGHDRDL